jgi:hypothetical protein
MGWSVVRGLAVLMLLSVPILVALNLPRLFDLVPASPSGPAVAITQREPEPLVTTRAKPTATLRPEPTATSTPLPRTATATPVGERGFITNTGGIGAVVRAEPATGPQVGSLREQTPVLVLERRRINGTEWARVRAEQGLEGWVIGVVVRPA